MVVVRMTDDGVSSWTVNTTAIGVSVNGRCIAGAGEHFMFVNTIDSLLDVTKISHTKQTSFRNASIVKWHPHRANIFVTTCSQMAAVYQYSPGGRVRTVNSGRLHPRNINDIDWSYTEDNTFMTCADGEPIAIWDCRSSLQRPTWELQAIAGAEQAKFAPSINNIISTAHGSDIRIWDDRYHTTPIASTVAHTGRITSLAWHPKKNTFVTSGSYGYIKIWDFTLLPSPIHSFGVLSQPVQKIKYSLDGEEFVTIPRPGAQAKTALTIWHSASLNNLQALKCDDDPVIDVSWQHRDNKKYLFTMRKSGVMRRYPLVSHQEISGSLDMAMPIAQSDADQEVDKMLAHATLAGIDAAKMYDRKGNPRQPMSPPKEVLPVPKFPGTWSRWMIAKSKHSNNLGSELEALRKLNTEGLITNEINFNRAACGFTYEHKSFEQKRIYIEIRFHAMFIKNSTILVKIHHKDCALDDDQAMSLLNLIEEECARIMLEEDGKPIHPGDQKCISIFGRVLQHLPVLINALEIPGTHIDIPTKRDGAENCYGRSVPRSDASDEDIYDQEQSKGTSMSYEPSPYDDFVPAPCTSGARFNASGYLTIFGRVNYSSTIQCLKFDDKVDDDWNFSYRRRQRKARTSRANRTVSSSEKPPKGIVRSLRDYEMVMRNMNDVRLQERTNSEYSLPDNVSTGAGVVGGNMWNVLRKDSVKQPIALGTSPSRSVAMQNISLTSIAHRNRGNSLTCAAVVSDEQYRLFSSIPKPVMVYDVNGLLPISKRLATKYRVIGGNAIDLVQHNMKVARRARRHDLVRVWTVIEQVIRGTVKEFRGNSLLGSSQPKTTVMKGPTDGVYDFDVVYEAPAADDHESECAGRDCMIRVTPWASNRVGRRLVNYIIDSFVRAGDFQTAALICCILHSRPQRDGTLCLQPLAKRSYSNMLATGDSAQQSGHMRSASSSSDTCNGGVSGHNTIHSGASFEVKGHRQRLADVTFPPVTTLELAQRGRSFESEPVVPTKHPPKGSRSILKKLFGGMDTPEIPSPPPPPKVESEDDESEIEIETMEEFTATETPGHPYQVDDSLLLIDPTLRERFEDVRSRYADVLFRWQMYVKSAEILKYNVPTPDDPGLLSARYLNRNRVNSKKRDDSKIDLRQNREKYTYKPMKNAPAMDQLKCTDKPLSNATTVKQPKWTKKPISYVKCTICQTPCKGHTVSCLACHHGGHMEHITEWFKKQTWCPTGCGCLCVI